jgi:hypothetical protein
VTATAVGGIVVAGHLVYRAAIESKCFGQEVTTSQSVRKIRKNVKALVAGRPRRN